MTSDEVAQRMHAQTAMFGANQAYAHQLSYGAGGSGMPPPPPPPPPPPAASRGDYRGAQFAGSLAGGAGAAAGMGLTAATWGLGLSAMPPALLAGMAMDRTVGAFTQGTQQFGSTQRMLDQNFKFFGGQGHQGRGFGIQQAGQITGMMQQTSQNDFRTSVNELQQLVSSGAQNGMFVGVQDVKQFTQRFKEMLSTLKTVQEELGGSLQEAMEFARQAKSAGVYGQSSIGRFSARVRDSMASSGLSQDQTMMLASQGAQLSRSVGGTGAQGAVGATRSAATLGAAMRTGAINEEMLAEATGGLTGSEGIAALTNQIMQRSARFTKTARGRYAMFGLSNSDATGLDQEALSALVSGDSSVSDISRRAHRNVNRMGRARAMNREGFLRGAIMEQGGMTANIAIMKQELGGRLEGMDDDLATLFLQRRHGMSRSQAELTQSLLRNSGEIAGQEAMDRRGARRAQSEEQYLSENSLDAQLQRFGRAARKTVGIDKIEEAGNRFAEGMATMFQDMTDKFLGISRSKMTSAQGKVLDRMSMGRGTTFDTKLMSAVGKRVGSQKFTGEAVGYQSALGSLMESIGVEGTGGSRSFESFFNELGVNYTDSSAGEVADRLQQVFKGGALTPEQQARISKNQGAIHRALGKTAGGDMGALERVRRAAKATGLSSEDVLASLSGTPGMVEGLQDEMRGKGSSQLRQRQAAAGEEGFLDSITGGLRKALGYTPTGWAAEKLGIVDEQKESPREAIFKQLRIGKGQEAGVRSLISEDMGLLEGLTSQDEARRKETLAKLDKMGAGGNQSAAALARATRQKGGLSMDQGAALMDPKALREMQQEYQDSVVAPRRSMITKMLGAEGEGGGKIITGDMRKRLQAMSKSGDFSGILSTSREGQLDFITGDQDEYDKQVQALSKAAQGDSESARSARDLLMATRSQHARYQELSGKGRRGARGALDSALSGLGIDAHDLSVSRGGRSRQIRGMSDLRNILMHGSGDLRDQLKGQIDEQLAMSGASEDTRKTIKSILADGRIGKGPGGEDEAKQYLDALGKDTGLQQFKKEQLESKLAERDPLGDRRNKELEKQTLLLGKIAGLNAEQLDSSENVKKGIQQLKNKDEGGLPAGEAGA